MYVTLYINKKRQEILGGSTEKELRPLIYGKIDGSETVTTPEPKQEEKEPSDPMHSILAKAFQDSPVALPKGMKDPRELEDKLPPKSLDKEVDEFVAKLNSSNTYYGSDDPHDDSQIV